MAVTAFTPSRPRASLIATSLPPGMLAVTLIAPALDLWRMLLPAASFDVAPIVAAVASALVLTAAWLRFPRTTWLAAAALAAVACVALRLAGADVAPVLSLLAVLALGVGGAFASPGGEVSTWLEA